LTDEQRAVLELVDGLRDVHGILDASGLVEFDVGKALYGLVSAGFIHRIGTSVRAPVQLPTDTARIEEHRNLGIAFYKTAMLDEALREFRRVLELRPNDPAAQRFMGLVLARREQWSEAMSAFQEAVEHPMAKYTAFHNLAYTLERQGRFSAARSALDEAVRRAGDADPRVVTSLGVVQFLAGDLADADRTLREARDLMGEARPPTSWFHYAGLAAALRGHLPRASAILEEGVELHPHAAILVNNLAVVLERRGLPDPARDMVDRGVRETSHLPQLYKNLGDLHYRAGRFDDALEAYVRASTIDPELGADLHLKLGNIHLRRREHADAIRCWERSLALDPDNAIVRANLASIREVM
jgi:Flp pilus assembly protein TadD